MRRVGATRNSRSYPQLTEKDIRACRRLTRTFRFRPFWSEEGGLGRFLHRRVMPWAAPAVSLPVTGDWRCGGLTFDTDFGELVYRPGLAVDSGIVRFRLAPDSPEDAADVALAMVASQPHRSGSFCVVTRDRIRVRLLLRGLGSSEFPSECLLDGFHRRVSTCYSSRAPCPRRKTLLPS